MKFIFFEGVMLLSPLACASIHEKVLKIAEENAWLCLATSNALTSLFPQKRAVHAGMSGTPVRAGEADWEEDVRTFLALPLDGVDLYQLNVFPGSGLAQAIASGKILPTVPLHEQGEYFLAGVSLMQNARCSRLSMCHWGRTTRERNLFTGLEKSAGGFVAFKGKPVSAKHLPRHAQVVLQNAGHQLRMRSVHSELDGAAAGIFRDKQKRAEKVTATLERYGLSALAGRHPQSLSGGEKQRLAVAAATIRDPDSAYS